MARSRYPKHFPASKEKPTKASSKRRAKRISNTPDEENSLLIFLSDLQLNLITSIGHVTGLRPSPRLTTLGTPPQNPIYFRSGISHTGSTHILVHEQTNHSTKEKSTIPKQITKSDIPVWKVKGYLFSTSIETFF
ncbi:hypothetical protein JCM33374_g2082 [Metschnikowia sp. JCM 33374]|nr:hypothetical protein JCM33374_g2082 [Metschnikowia sp. JCM 33374]